MHSDPRPGQGWIAALLDAYTRLAAIHKHVIETYGTPRITSHEAAFDIDTAVSDTRNINIIDINCGIEDVDSVGIDRGGKAGIQDIDRAGILNPQQGGVISRTAEITVIEGAAFRAVEKYFGVILIGTIRVEYDRKSRSAHCTDLPLDFQAGAIFKHEIHARLDSKRNSIQDTDISPDLMRVVGHQKGGICGDITRDDYGCG